jgi:RimJ/RimL family protein N-acetyltransferase
MGDHKQDNLSSSVQLREVETNDIPVLFQHQKDPAAIEMAVVYSREENDFRAHWEKIIQDQEVTVLAVISQDKLVGYVTCFKMDGLDSVGYWIDREFWGRGIATRALEMLLERVSIRPLHARVARVNAGSVRVLEKCGFVVECYRVSDDDDRFPSCEEAVMLLE